MSRDNKAMNAAVIDQRASNWVVFAEAKIAQRANVNRDDARELLAQESGIAAGTLYNIKRRRIKGVRAWVEERLKAVVMRELKLECQRLSNELDMVRQGGADPRSDEMVEIQTHLARVRELLSEG